MKPFFGALGVGLIGLLIYGLATGVIKSPTDLYFNSPIERIITVRGESSSAPVPVSVDLHLHKNGTVTWKSNKH